jgi:hypothetical protein
MSETDTIESLPRKLRMEDFLSESEPTNKYDRNYSQNDNTISKNQREFGHKKRIKP